MIAVTVGNSSRAARTPAREERRPATWGLRIFIAAVGVVAFRVVDDNYLQPAAGTSAGEHLAGGLVPLGALGLVSVVYPRLRPGHARTRR